MQGSVLLRYSSEIGACARSGTVWLLAVAASAGRRDVDRCVCGVGSGPVRFVVVVVGTFGTVRRRRRRRVLLRDRCVCGSGACAGPIRYWLLAVVLCRRRITLLNCVPVRFLLLPTLLLVVVLLEELLLELLLFQPPFLIVFDLHHKKNNCDHLTRLF